MIDYRRTFILICEGRCNPYVSSIDADIRRLTSLRKWSDIERPREDDGYYGRYQLGDAELWRLQRRLIYTPHHMVSPQLATCEVCGSERRYGSSGF